MDFIQNQIFGMQWLSDLFTMLLNACGINSTMGYGASLHFFLYDLVKITILLWTLIVVISYIQSYFSAERARESLGSKAGFKSYILAALLGTVTPFCACSSIPLFIGFTSARLPLGVTFAFLISSPLVDLASLVLLSSIFGVEVAVLYTVLGIVLAVLGGYVIEALKMQNYVADFIYQTKVTALVQSERPTQLNRLKLSLEQTWSTFKKVFIYILIGVGIGALIHNLIPNEYIALLLGTDNMWSVPLATLAGAPIYADIFGTIPIAEVLLDKGASLGTVLALMMSVTTLSIPSLIMLKQAIKLRLLMTFVAICLVGIVVCGYVFNLVQPYVI